MIVRYLYPLQRYTYKKYSYWIDDHPPLWVYNPTFDCRHADESQYPHSLAPSQQMNMYRKNNFWPWRICSCMYTSRHITPHYLALHYKQKTYVYIYIYIYIYIFTTPQYATFVAGPKGATQNALHPGGPESRDGFPLPSSLRKLALETS